MAQSATSPDILDDELNLALYDPTRYPGVRFVSTNSPKTWTSNGTVWVFNSDVPQVIVPDRRNHAVNGASVEDFTAVAGSAGPVLRTNTQVNAAGGFNGGGTGNKAMLGHWFTAPLPLGALASLQVDYEQLTPEAGLVGNTRAARRTADRARERRIAATRRVVHA